LKSGTASGIEFEYYGNDLVWHEKCDRNENKAMGNAKTKINGIGFISRYCPPVGPL